MSELEIIDLAAKILALFHSGIIKMGCQTCSDPSKYNCNMEIVEESVYYHPELGDLYTCPIRMVPGYVYDWYDEYLHNSTFNVSTLYNEKNYFQWQFEKAYKMYSDKYTVMAAKQPKADPEEKKKGLAQFKSIAARNKAKE